MSAYSTSWPNSHTRLYRMRPLSSSCTWCRETSWVSVAAYTLMGTLTSPNAMEPFQIDLMGT